MRALWIEEKRGTGGWGRGRGRGGERQETKRIHTQTKYARKRDIFKPSAVGLELSRLVRAILLLILLCNKRARCLEAPCEYAMQPAHTSYAHACTLIFLCLSLLLLMLAMFLCITLATSSSAPLVTTLDCSSTEVRTPARANPSLGTFRCNSQHYQLQGLRKITPSPAPSSRRTPAQEYILTGKSSRPMADPVVLSAARTSSSSFPPQSSMEFAFSWRYFHRDKGLSHKMVPFGKLFAVCQPRPTPNNKKAPAHLVPKVPYRGLRRRISCVSR